MKYIKAIDCYLCPYERNIETYRSDDSRIINVHYCMKLHRMWEIPQDQITAKTYQFDDCPLYDCNL